MRRSGPDQPWGIPELVVALRWASLSLSLLRSLVSGADGADLAAGAALMTVALARTAWPLRMHGVAGERSAAGERSFADSLAALGELGTSVAAVAVTGWSASPFVFSLGAGTFTTALVVGPAVFAVGGVLAIAVVTGCALAGAVERPEATRAVGTAAALSALALLASYTKWLAADTRREPRNLVRMRDLFEVNRLLLDLEARLARSPDTVDLRKAIVEPIARLREPLAPDALVLVVKPDDAEAGTWDVAYCDGIALPAAVTEAQLPPPVLECAALGKQVMYRRLGAGDGVLPSATSGIYAPLKAGRQVLAVLAIERGPRAPAFSQADANLTTSVTRVAALAMENADLFRSLREAGAQNERERIARELHDRLGQTLAYVAISLDTLAGSEEMGSEARSRGTGTELRHLAEEVREATRDLRDEISELRSQEHTAPGLAAGLELAVKRACLRWSVSATTDIGGDVDTPVHFTRSATRIVEEAIANAARHGRAHHVHVSWSAHNGSGLLQIDDDGTGMAPTANRGPDRFGIVGMEERAASLGGTLTLGNAEAGGTSIRVQLPLPAGPPSKDRQVRSVERRYSNAGGRPQVVA